MTVKYLNVNEIFGPTVQGEGVNAGKYVGFLRLAGCNLACSWCDTPYSWDWERYDKKAESHRWLIEDVASEVHNLAVDTLIVSGGEPMVQQKGIVALKDLIQTISFEIETNGTIAPTSDTVQAISLFTVSPKLAHSGDPEKLRIKKDVLFTFGELSWDGKAVFKFVCQTEQDLDEVLKLTKELRIPREAVWIMPEGKDPQTHLANLNKLADAVVKKGFNLTARLHILAWGSKRGV